MTVFVDAGQQESASGWSFTDCTSKIAIGDAGVGTALALDQHFLQFEIQVAP